MATNFKQHRSSRCFTCRSAGKANSHSSALAKQIHTSLQIWLIAPCAADSFCPLSTILHCQHGIFPVMASLCSMSSIAHPRAICQVCVDACAHSITQYLVALPSFFALSQPEMPVKCCRHRKHCWTMHGTKKLWPLSHGRPSLARTPPSPSRAPESR